MLRMTSLFAPPAGFASSCAMVRETFQTRLSQPLADSALPTARCDYFAPASIQISHSPQIFQPSSAGLFQNLDGDFPALEI